MLSGAWRNGLAYGVAPVLVIGWVLTSTATSLGLWTLGMLVLGLVAVVWPILDHRASNAHRRHYREFAESHGWTYTARTMRYTGVFHGFPFGMGSERQQLDLIEGTLGGMECASFTHSFTQRSDRGSDTTSHFQVSMVHVPVYLPRLDVLPENTATRVLAQIGAPDISMESYEFNRRWRVKCADRRFAYDLLDPRMIDRLTWYDTDGMAFRFEANAIMMWQHGRRDTDDLARRFAVLVGLARRIPDHVARRLSEERAAATEVTGPDWATTPFALTQGRYTGENFEQVDIEEARSTAPRPAVLDWSTDWDGHWDTAVR